VSGLYFDKEGEQISAERWAELHQNIEYVRCAWDPLPHGGHLSTVWLGIDHQFGSGAPIIFESMEFDSQGCECGAVARYSTLDDALVGHARLLLSLLGQH